MAVPADPDALREAHRRMMDEYLRVPEGVPGVAPDEGSGSADAQQYEFEMFESELAELRKLAEGLRAAFTGLGE